MPFKAVVCQISAHTQSTALILVEALTGVHAHALNDLLWLSCGLFTTGISTLCVLQYMLRHDDLDKLTWM